MFYKFCQNNSGGYFHNTDVFCPVMVFQCDSEEEALGIAQDKGIYFDGVKKGIDCPCCGDRWSKYPDFIDLHKVLHRGIEAYVYAISSDEFHAASEWHRKFGKYNIVEEPHLIDGYRYVGKVSFGNIEEYFQYYADEYVSCNSDIYPAVRIFYKNGDVTTIRRTPRNTYYDEVNCVAKALKTLTYGYNVLQKAQKDMDAGNGLSAETIQAMSSYLEG